MRLAEPLRTSLGIDPTNRACAINGYAFQQDAIRTFNDWQYACFYASSSPSAKEPLFVHLSRRKLPDGPWQTIRFEDYPQTVDDGHNTVQVNRYFSRQEKKKKKRICILRVQKRERIGVFCKRGTARLTREPSLTLSEREYPCSSGYVQETAPSTYHTIITAMYCVTDIRKRT